MEKSQGGESALRPSCAKDALALVTVGLTSGMAKVEWRALHLGGWWECIRRLASSHLIRMFGTPKKHAPRMARNHGNTCKLRPRQTYSVTGLLFSSRIRTWTRSPFTSTLPKT